MTIKKFFAVILLIAAVSCSASSYAGEASKATFRGVTFGQPYKIPGYASVTLLGFKYVNMYAQWDDGKAGTAQRGYWPQHSDTDLVYSSKPRTGTTDKTYAYENCSFKFSGNEAEFAWLKTDVINLQKTPVNFMKEISVKVIYDDEYEYEGWVRQFNYDYSNSEIYKHKDTTAIGWPVCLSPVDEMPIKPMYKGHYAFGCTLPNSIVEDKDSPLRMIISIGDNTLIYNIR